MPDPGDQPELIDRTLAIVGGQPITLCDARTALALGLVEGRGADPIAAASHAAGRSRADAARGAALRAAGADGRAHRRAAGRDPRNGVAAGSGACPVLRAAASPRRGCAPGFATICASRPTWRSALPRRACRATPRLRRPTRVSVPSSRRPGRPSRRRRDRARAADCGHAARSCSPTGCRSCAVEPTS